MNYLGKYYITDNRICRAKINYKRTEKGEEIQRLNNREIAADWQIEKWG